MHPALAKLPKAPKMPTYDRMCAAIDKCAAVEDAKAIRDKALALAAWAKQARNREAERKCAKIRIRAERKTGQLLAEAAKNGSRKTQGGDRRSKSHKATMIPSLHELGIKRDQSADWQKLASIPEEEFDTELEGGAAAPSTEKILRTFQLLPKSDMAGLSPDARMLLGSIMEFERNGFLKREPGELLKTMTHKCLEDLRRVTPRLIGWLKELEEHAKSERRPVGAAGDAQADTTGSATDPLPGTEDAHAHSANS